MNSHKPIIEVKNIGKKYDITHLRGGYVSLRDVLSNVFKNPFSFAGHKIKGAIGLAKKEEFWALKNISFTVEKGDVVGIIGRNGAGKSTLLKILTGITPPTEGEAIIRGRVGSLLEVGTGFHPELTGRDNIFLNGAILGMKRKEIVKKFDEIVAFAGIEKFLDTPVKHYSSGMYVRLAFSVAAHMDPEILLIDEVLAVGDAEFQKKCLGKMDQITKEQGRTILFVSHNLNAIQQLCKKSVVLQHGKVVFQGNTEDAIAFYSDLQTNEPAIDLEKNVNRRGNGAIKLTGFHTEDSSGKITHTIKSGQPFRFVFSYTCPDPTSIHDIDIGISIQKNMMVLNSQYSSFIKQNAKHIQEKGTITFDALSLPLNPGVYEVGTRILANGTEADWPKNVVGSFEILPKDSDIEHGYKIDTGSIIPIDGTWIYA